MRRFQMTVSIVAMMSVLLMLTASFVRAKSADPQSTEQKEVTAEKILADVFFLRPVGVVATAFGIATYLVTLPITLTTHSHATVGKKLVSDPWKYTFQRPVGHLE